MFQPYRIYLCYVDEFANDNVFATKETRCFPLKHYRKYRFILNRFSLMKAVLENFCSFSIVFDQTVQTFQFYLNETLSIFVDIYYIKQHCLQMITVYQVQPQPKMKGNNV